MYDRVDEWVVSALTEFDGKPLQLGRHRATSISARSAATPRSRSQKTQARRVQGLLVERIQDVLKDRRQRGAPHPPPDRFARLPGQRRARHEHEPGAAAEGRRARSMPSMKPVLEINPRPSDRRTPRRTKPTTGRFADWSHIAVRSGDARRGRTARRSGDVRQAPQRADADARRRRRRRESGRRGPRETHRPEKYAHENWQT